MGGSWNQGKRGTGTGSRNRETGRGISKVTVSGRNRGILP